MKFSRAFPAPLRLLVFGVLSGAASLHAGIITVPTGLTVGQHYRLVFATLDTYSATSSDINFYNNAVNSEANGVAALHALNTVWRDIGSTPTVNAIDNIGQDPGVPIYDLEGNLVARTPLRERTACGRVRSSTSSSGTKQERMGGTWKWKPAPARTGSATRVTNWGATGRP